MYSVCVCVCLCVYECLILFVSILLTLGTQQTFSSVFYPHKLVFDNRTTPTYIHDNILSIKALNKTAVYFVFSVIIYYTTNKKHITFDCSLFSRLERLNSQNEMMMLLAMLLVAKCMK